MNSRAMAAAAVAASGPRPVEVTGSGALASAIRTELDVTQGSSDERPGTVVVTSGDVAEIQEALARVRDLGLVVLVAAPTPDAPRLDLYTDLHVRGLTVVGVPEPAE